MIDVRSMKAPKLQEINDFYYNKGLRGKKLRKALDKDKKYQKFLRMKRQKLTKTIIALQEKVSKSEEQKYVLSVDNDFLILEKCKQLEKAKLTENDREVVKLIKSQLQDDWRKLILKSLDKLMKKYRI